MPNPLVDRLRRRRSRRRSSRPGRATARSPMTRPDDSAGQPEPRRGRGRGPRARRRRPTTSDLAARRGRAARQGWRSRAIPGMAHRPRAARVRVVPHGAEPIVRRRAGGRRRTASAGAGSRRPRPRSARSSVAPSSVTTTWLKKRIGRPVAKTPIAAVRRDHGTRDAGRTRRAATRPCSRAPAGRGSRRPPPRTVAADRRPLLGSARCWPAGSPVRAFLGRMFAMPALPAGRARPADVPARRAGAPGPGDGRRRRRHPARDLRLPADADPRRAPPLRPQPGDPAAPGVQPRVPVLPRPAGDRRRSGSATGPARYGLRLGDWRWGLGLAVAGCVVMTPIVLVAARHARLPAYYAPSIGAAAVARSRRTSLDLVSTEFIYRGFLMLALARVFGPIALSSRCSRSPSPT